MPSAILVQRPREDALAEEKDSFVRIRSVESRVDDISVNKVGEPAQWSRTGRFDFDVEMHESSRTKDSLKVKYSFTLRGSASGNLSKVSGEALVRFSQFNPDADFHTLGNDITSEMAVEIFRKNYEAIYLLHDTLGIEAPSPWITQEVSLSARSQES